MIIPNGPSGFPTVSPNMLRKYGTGGFRLADHEKGRGCPRLFRKTYVEHDVPDQEDRYNLDYGQLIHGCLQIMEEESITPEEALDRLFPATFPPEAYMEAINDLNGYMERGASPTDRYGTLATEQHVTALIYEDPDFGPIYGQGFIDWIGVDLDDPGRLHVVDYKTNRHPPSQADVKGDVQMRFYDMLMRRKWSTYMPKGTMPKITIHLDAIKWREVTVDYGPEDVQVFEAWLIAVIRRILRDEVGAPRLNPGCAWCPVQDSCPAYIALPDVAATLLNQDRVNMTDDEKIAWRDKAWGLKSLLESAGKKIDAEFQKKALAEGGLVLEKFRWDVEANWINQIDLVELHSLTGDDFYDLVSGGKGKIEAYAKTRPASEGALILQTIKRVAEGTAVVKRERKDDD